MRTLWRVSLGALVAANLQAQGGPIRGGPATITGMVADSIGRPVPGADIVLLSEDSAVSATRSDDNGRFTVSGQVQQHNWLQVRRLGFQPRDVELFFPRDSARPLFIQLDAAAQDLLATEIRDSSDAAWSREFDQRRQSNSHGHYFTRDAILRRKPMYLSEMLRTVPGITVSQLRTGGFRLRMRGCRYAPMIWIDGTRMPQSELDEVARVDDVGAMEVYTTSAGVPAQYLDRSNLGCGTILVWTLLY